MRDLTSFLSYGLP